MLLDEPFAAIDEATRGDLLALIESWRDAGRTVICVLHDVAIVRDHFSMVMRVNGAWGPTAEVLGPA